MPQTHDVLGLRVRLFKNHKACSSVEEHAKKIIVTGLKKKLAESCKIQ